MFIEIDTTTPPEAMTVQACLRVLDAIGLEGWQEGQQIFALEPTRSGVQIASFEANGLGLRAFLQSLQPCAN